MIKVLLDVILPPYDADTPIALLPLVVTVVLLTMSSPPFAFISRLSFLRSLLATRAAALFPVVLMLELSMAIWEELSQRAA